MAAATSRWCCPTTSCATPSCQPQAGRRRRKSSRSRAFSSRKIHGERAKGWEVRLSRAGGGARLACAIDAALLERLKACFPKGGKARLVSVQPALMAAYNRARERIPREGAWLLLGRRRARVHRAPGRRRAGLGAPTAARANGSG